MLNQLIHVNIPPRVSHIGKGAFLLNRLNSVQISANLVEIGESAFVGNKITRINIGSDITFAGGDIPSFDNDFDNYYNTNGKKAGIYDYSNGQWSMKEEQ
jgi:hypothetical protein